MDSVNVAINRNREKWEFGGRNRTALLPSLKLTVLSHRGEGRSLVNWIDGVGKYSNSAEGGKFMLSTV